MPDQVYLSTDPNDGQPASAVAGGYLSTDPNVGEAVEPVSFVPKTAKEFLQRLAGAAVDVPVGMVKSAARMGQMIPGMTAATDKLYGLPAGASEQSTQPTNATQAAGGLLNDVALAVATGGAEVGGPIIGRTAGYLSNPTVAQRGAVAAGRATDFTANVATALRTQLSSGPVTPEKVASLIVKYGKDAVKGAIVAGGGYGAWQAVKHLF